MLALNYSTIRNSLKTYFDKIIAEQETIIVTRKNNKNIVMMSLDEYNQMQESIKILRNPEYFMKLYKSMKELSEGKTVTKTIEQLDSMGKEL